MALELVFVTGMSGAGKSTALKIMEDLGFFCVDNLPISLIDTFVQLTNERDEGTGRVSMGVDIRSREALSDLQPILADLKQEGISYKILFLDADNGTLVKRYKETRRNHPLAGDDRIEKGMEREREALGFLKEEADYIIDTSQLLTRDLHAELERIFIARQDFRNLMITILSFGFKYGIPEDSDLVFDVRFLPNPYYIPELRPLSGKDEAVRTFLQEHTVTGTFTEKLVDLVRFLIPHYMEEGKNQLVISVGCTGGKHRSVMVAEELYAQLRDARDYGIRIEHRDMEKDKFRKGE